MSDFFDQVDSIGIVERHIQRVVKLEEDQAKKLLRRYREVRQELRDRLDRVNDDTFTAQRLRGTLAQVEGALEAMSSSLKSGMNDSAFTMAMQGIDDQVTEIKRFEEEFRGAVIPIDLDAQLVAQDTNEFLINRYDASIESYSEALRSQIVGTLTNESLMQTPYSSVIRKLSSFFQGEEWKLHRIARTELHNIYNVGKLNGMTAVQEDILPDLMKTLIHPMDSRTGDDSKYAARLNMIVPLDKPFRYKWNGEWREYMAPPDRCNDRSILVPYRKIWSA